MSDPVAVSRRLVAVFAADVEGYSRLMGADEVGTLRGLTERRAILDRIIGEYRGRCALSLWQHSAYGRSCCRATAEQNAAWGNLGSLAITAHRSPTKVLGSSLSHRSVGRPFG
jgi:class 3 adenylate cyclase